MPGPSAVLCSLEVYLHLDNETEIEIWQATSAIFRCLHPKDAFAIVQCHFLIALRFNACGHTFNLTPPSIITSHCTCKRMLIVDCQELQIVFLVHGSGVDGIGFINQSVGLSYNPSASRFSSHMKLCHSFIPSNMYITPLEEEWKLDKFGLLWKQAGLVLTIYTILHVTRYTSPILFVWPPVYYAICMRVRVSGEWHVANC